MIAEKRRIWRSASWPGTSNEETLRAANVQLIDYHQRLSLTAVFGAGTRLSRSAETVPCPVGGVTPAGCRGGYML